MTHKYTERRELPFVFRQLRPLWAVTLLFASAGLLAFAACEPDDDTGDESTPTPGSDDDSPTPTATPETLEIVGTYTDDFGGNHEITETSWTMGYTDSVSVFHITQWSNDSDSLIAQNDSSNVWSPDLWSRFDWLYSGADLYYCQTEYGAESEEAAEAATPANADDLAGGCGGFSWSKLTPEYGSAKMQCAPGGPGGSDPFVDCVVDYSPGGFIDQMFGYDVFPEIVEGEPEGAGDVEGGTDVLSLGCGGSITLFFDDPILTDGPGADFIVFENAFSSGGTTFAEPGLVSVSSDGNDWVTFPCVLEGNATWPPTGCAGITPVYANSENGIDPLEPEAAGGDAFDLADVGVDTARYIRITDASVEYFGHTTWCVGATGGFDLDAVALIHTLENVAE